VAYFAMVCVLGLIQFSHIKSFAWNNAFRLRQPSST